MIDSRDRLVDTGLQLLQRGCVGAAAFKRKPRAGQRRPQIVGDIVAYTRQRVDHRLHFIEHAIDDRRKLRERVVEVAVGKPLPEVSGDDALDPLVDLLDSFLCTHAQPRSRQEAETERRQQTKRKRLANDVRNLGCFVDLAPDHQNVAILHASRDRARLLLPTIGLVQPNDLRALRRHIDFKTARQLCHVPRNPVPADTE